MSGGVTAVEVGTAVAEGVGAAAEVGGAMAAVDGAMAVGSMTELAGAGMSVADGLASGAFITDAASGAILDATTGEVVAGAGAGVTDAAAGAAEADAYGYGAGNAAGTAGSTGYAASGQAASDLASAAASASGLPSWVSPAVQAGSKLATGMMQANAARTAASQIAAADAKAGEENLAIYDKQQALQAPWVQAGQTALTQLEQGTAEGGRFNRPFSLADMQSSAVNPTYQFTNDEALAAMKNQAAAGGQNLSVNTLEGVGKLSGNIASQFENQAFNQYQSSNDSALQPLQSLAKVGQSATNQTQAAGSDYVGNQIPLTTGAGAAQAAGTVASSNALTQGIGGAINTVASSPQIMNSLASIFN